MKTLDKTERQVLLHKHMASGLDFYESRDKVDNFHDYLINLRDKLKATGKTDIDIETKFKQEFEKMVQKLQ